MLLVFFNLTLYLKLRYRPRVVKLPYRPRVVKLPYRPMVVKLPYRPRVVKLPYRPSFVFRRFYAYTCGPVNYVTW